jgi:hypothetical protein
MRALTVTATLLASLGLISSCRSRSFNGPESEGKAIAAVTLDDKQELLKQMLEIITIIAAHEVPRGPNASEDEINQASKKLSKMELFLKYKAALEINLRRQEQYVPSEAMRFFVVEANPFAEQPQRDFFSMKEENLPKNPLVPKDFVCVYLAGSQDSSGRGGTGSIRDWVRGIGYTDKGKEGNAFAARLKQEAAFWVSANAAGSTDLLKGIEDKIDLLATPKRGTDVFDSFFTTLTPDTEVNKVIMKLRDVVYEKQMFTDIIMNGTFASVLAHTNHFQSTDVNELKKAQSSPENDKQWTNKIPFLGGLAQSVGNFLTANRAAMEAMKPLIHFEERYPFGPEGYSPYLQQRKSGKTMQGFMRLNLPTFKKTLNSGEVVFEYETNTNPYVGLGYPDPKTGLPTRRGPQAVELSKLIANLEYFDKTSTEQLKNIYRNLGTLLKTMGLNLTQDEEAFFKATTASSPIDATGEMSTADLAKFVAENTDSMGRLVADSKTFLDGLAAIQEEKSALLLNASLIGPLKALSKVFKNPGSDSMFVASQEVTPGLTPNLMHYQSLGSYKAMGALAAAYVKTVNEANADLIAQLGQPAVTGLTPEDVDMSLRCPLSDTFSTQLFKNFARYSNRTQQFMQSDVVAPPGSGGMM